MHQELNQRPKDVVRPPAAHVGGPWWLGTTGLGGRPDGDKMLPARHLRMPAHDLKPIGADAHAPTRHVGVAAPPRAVRFWAKKWPQHGEEARQARRQATLRRYEATGGRVQTRYSIKATMRIQSNLWGRLRAPRISRRILSATWNVSLLREQDTPPLPTRMLFHTMARDWSHQNSIVSRSRSHALHRRAVERART